VLLLTLVDADTPLHLAGDVDRPELRDWLAFHAPAPLVGATDAAFAVGRWADLQPLGRFPQGRPDYPDRSATLIVELDRLAAEGAELAGPGVAPGARLTLPDPDAFRANHALFPLGIDVFFTCGDRLAALPRSTRVL
jgi:alpha-D-ribose 1-methylphosphonate 5-triphosphate synthase subunit PhnH